MYKSNMIEISCWMVFTACILFLNPGYCLTNNTKLILTWIPFYGNTTFWFGNGSPKEFRSAGCRYSNCKIISNRSEYPLETIDALLFHAAESYHLFGRPSTRLQNQIYVFVCFESAHNTLIAENKRYFYNLTMTYRLDSDIVWTNFRVYDTKTGTLMAPAFNPKWDLSEPETDLKLPENIEAAIENKKYMAAWFVSHCNTVSRREYFVKKLIAFGIDVHVYGSCGKFNCTREDGLEIASQYYFYLAFENSLCEDYLTEKTWRALNSGTVPVVLSGANLTRFLPPNSYIDARKLGPQKVAEEMKRLISNRALYENKFSWHRNYETSKWLPKGQVWKMGEHPFCELCEALHTEKFKRRNPLDVIKWWESSQSGNGESCILNTPLDWLNNNFKYARKVL